MYNTSSFTSDRVYIDIEKARGYKIAFQQQFEPREDLKFITQELDYNVSINFNIFA